MYKLVTFLILLLTFYIKPQAQSPCYNPATSNCHNSISGSSEFLMTTSGNIDFVFNESRDYVAGITQSGKTMLRLKIDPLNANCRWKLIMYIDNNMTLPEDEWETLVHYGQSGENPNLDLIEVKVYNGCGTPLNSGVFQIFDYNIQHDILEIIPNVPANTAGNCDGSHVNVAGSYLTNYNEYNFIIDYRIKPGFRFRSGAYQIRIHFCLVEV